MYFNCNKPGLAARFNIPY